MRTARAGSARRRTSGRRTSSPFSTVLLLVACAGAGILLGRVIETMKPVRELPVTWPADVAAAGMRFGPANAGAMRGLTGTQNVLRVFGDYQCPACSDFDARVGSVLEPLVREGRLAIVHHHAPFRAHPRAAIAAATAYCAGAGRSGRPGSLLHTSLFTSVGDWASSPDPVSTLISVASVAGEDTTGMRACMQSDGAARVERDRDLAARLGISALPVVFLDDARLEFGSWDGLLRHIRRTTSP